MPEAIVRMPILCIEFLRLSAGDVPEPRSTQIFQSVSDEFATTAQSSGRMLAISNTRLLTTRGSAFRLGSEPGRLRGCCVSDRLEAALRRGESANHVACRAGSQDKSEDCAAV
jgi:hypothetical protein